MAVNKNICVICGHAKIKSCSPLCVKCSPFIYKKGQAPHKKIIKTKEWKDNRAKRLKEANFQCEWCETGTEKGLTPHHQEPIKYKKIWYKLVDTFFEYLINNKNEWQNSWETLRSEDSIEKRKALINETIYQKSKNEKKVRACPSCDSYKISPRKYQKPTYRCADCGKEFDNPEIRLSKKYNKTDGEIQSQIKREIINELKFQIITIFYERIKNSYEAKVNKLVQDYVKMGNTLLLCKRCHYYAEQGKVLCSQCKKHYHYPRYSTCSSCNTKNKHELNKTAEPCTDEIEGYCNHLGEYFYGERIKCKRLLCSDYTPAKVEK